MSDELKSIDNDFANLLSGLNSGQEGFVGGFQGGTLNNPMSKVPASAEDNKTIEVKNEETTVEPSSTKNTVSSETIPDVKSTKVEEISNESFYDLVLTNKKDNESDLDFMDEALESFVFEDINENH